MIAPPTAGDRSPDAFTDRPLGLPRPCRLVESRQENYRTRTLVLDLAIPAAPGQFCMLWLPGLDEKPFSLRSASPASFTIAAVGPFSRALHRLSPGDRIWLRGPFGRPFHLQGEDHLLGGGYGVAPMLFLARQALARGQRVRAVVGAREARDLLLLEAFGETDAELHWTTEDGSQGQRGRVTDAIAPMLAADPPDSLYACGPHPMLAALAAACDAHGLPAQLSWEAYMRCGIGICGSCEHEGRLLCADGPVLDHPAQAGPQAHPPAPEASRSG
jgi:dihydroorotate dehydrogenase electron transfer subunit